MHELPETVSTTRPRRRIAGLLTRFRQSRDGVTMVEFGMVAAPFFLTMFAILEVAMLLWSQQVLETATETASRLIYTGQFQTDPSNATYTSAQLAARFKSLLCADVVALFDCQNGLSIDIRNVTDFSSASVPPMIVNGQFNTGSFSYQNVTAGQIALVTAAIEYSTYTKMFVGTPGLTSGNRILVATSIFQTEPYQ